MALKDLLSNYDEENRKKAEAAKNAEEKKKADALVFKADVNTLFNEVIKPGIQKLKMVFESQGWQFVESQLVMTATYADSIEHACFTVGKNNNSFQFDFTASSVTKVVSLDLTAKNKKQASNSMRSDSEQIKLTDNFDDLEKKIESLMSPYLSS